MSKVTITKEDFMKMFEELDIPFQTAAILKLIYKMPTSYANILIRKLFYTRVYSQPYYVMYKEDWFEFYGTREEITDYLIEEYPLIDKGRITRLFSGKIPTLNGYYIQLFSN
jgi:hypothetical protein